jgi:hypothetical protein
MSRIEDRDDNEVSGRAPYGDAKIATPKEDFDRNRDGLYGGLPQARDENAEGPKANRPHLAKK